MTIVYKVFMMERRRKKKKKKKKKTALKSHIGVFRGFGKLYEMELNA